jgi:hypothetical protein
MKLVQKLLVSASDPSASAGSSSVLTKHNFIFSFFLLNTAFLSIEYVFC